MDTYFVMPDTRVKVVDGKVRYTGEVIPVEFEGNKAIDLLVKAGVMKEPEQKVWKGGIYFEDALNAEGLENRVNQALELIEMPTGEESLVTLKGKKEVSEEFRDYKNKGFVARTNKNEQLLMAQELSKQVLGKGKGEYALMPTQKSYDLVHSDKEFKKLMNDYWIHNIENIFSKEGVSSLRSYWDTVEGCFGALAGRPSDRNDHGLAVFEKLPSTQERIDREKIEFENLKNSKRKQLETVATNVNGLIQNAINKSREELEAVQFR